ncbi:YjiH family protein [Bacillus luteolus]|uniref:YjiH family protein n=1 Tax=Litchfieldia luteola TaxID=682179 RepID=A0ABR9QEU7_9BACI|nr:YjiH family protein [Cytobacillus luteolus]MBE4907023.1 YjiH family protein [Cytobacillus luteolus]MBP1943510.1 nucleoside recognition membrane protein YjiH [Cytobacillus luteolus]
MENEGLKNKGQVELNRSISTSGFLQFFIPSAIGIILFVIPFPYEEGVTIPVAILAKQVQAILSDSLPYIATAFVVLAVVLSLFTSLVKPRFITKSIFFSKLFKVSTFWLIARLIGMVFSIMALFRIGPEWIWSDVTGGLLLFELIPVLFSVFLFAGLLLPLLLDFGLLDLCGAMLKKIMRPLFTLPGRSSIDCLASWLGDGTIGVLLTTKQYEEGYYTKREAAVIGTTFSVVSITFTIVIIAYMDLEHMFGPFYLSIVVAGLVAAIICPRIPPLSRKPDTYYEEAEKRLDETIPEGLTPFRWGLLKAVSHAERNNNYGAVVKGGIGNVLDMWLGVIPIVMAIGTVALVIAEFTPVFTYLGAPFVPILNVLQVPEANEAAQTMVIGFADMFLPAIIGSSIESELTRFVIGAVSVTQLIYMSEVGGLLLGSKLPVSFTDLVIIFLQRTFITLPIIVLFAHLFF